MSLRESSKIGLFGKRTAAFTLAEVTMCIAVAGVIFVGIFAGYVQSAHGSERSEQALSVLGLAQADEGRTPAVEEAMQHPTVVLADTDQPISIAD